MNGRVAEEGGDGLGGNMCGGEELLDGMETVLTEEFVMVQAGEDMYGAAEITFVKFQDMCYVERCLDFAMGQNNTDHHVENVAIGSRERNFF